MPRSCQIPTPNEYTKVMVDAAGYFSDLAGKRVLENSCGRGNILAEIVKRYITDCKMHELSEEQIRQGLMKDIVGYEVDQSCVNVCIEKLNDILSKENIRNIKWDIRTTDYLCTEPEEFDYVIGNPPYITYHNLKDDERSYLKNNFSTCLKGRFDYYYAFVEKSYFSLKNEGVLVYLVPFSIFRNKFADTLRKLIKGDIVEVLDYSGIQIFEGVTTSSAVICVRKGSNQGKLEYRKISSNKHLKIDKKLLLGKWFFVNRTGKKRFGDYYSVQNSIATLCNDAFLITKYDDADGYIVVKDFKIEKSILRPAVSTKICKGHNRKKALIIFPYKNNDIGYSRYSEQEFLVAFPKACEYMKSFSKRLVVRKVNKGVRWFEYGRTQALKAVKGEKLVIPMVITSKVTAYFADERTIPYAGYFIKSKGKYSLNFAKQLLEGQRFYEYVKEKGTPTTKTSYRIAVKEIEDFTF